MIPKASDVEVRNSGILETTGMSIDLGSLGHLMSVLTNLYSDPLLAVIREYSTNAWDSHILAGNTETPIEVTLPTRLEPTFIVKDYGVGMSVEDIKRVFIKYGASDKRESNDFNGQLGLGCKSAFAICNQFIVEAVKDNKKAIYTLHLDEGSFGAASLMWEGETEEPNGVTISIPVKEERVADFIHKASKFYYTFTDKVKFIGREGQTKRYTSDVVFATDSGLKFIYNPNQSFETSGVLTGGVLYPHKMLPDNFILEMPIGSVFFTPNREGLIENASTDKTISEAIAEAQKELFDYAFSEIIHNPVPNLEFYGFRSAKDDAATVSRKTHSRKTIGFFVDALARLDVGTREGITNANYRTRFKFEVSPLATPNLPITFTLSSNRPPMLEAQINIDDLKTYLGVDKFYVKDSVSTSATGTLDLYDVNILVNKNDKSAGRFAPSYARGLRYLLEDDIIAKGTLNAIVYSKHEITERLTHYLPHRHKLKDVEAMLPALENLKLLFEEYDYEYFKELYDENTVKTTRKKPILSVLNASNNRRGHDSYSWSTLETVPSKSGGWSHTSVLIVPKTEKSKIPLRELDLLASLLSAHDGKPRRVVSCSQKVVALLHIAGFEISTLEHELAVLDSKLQEAKIYPSLEHRDYPAVFHILKTTENNQTKRPFFEDIKPEIQEEIELWHRLSLYRSNLRMHDIKLLLPETSPVFSIKSVDLPILKNKHLLHAIDASPSKWYNLSSKDRLSLMQLVLSETVAYLNQ